MSEETGEVINQATMSPHHRLHRYTDTKWWYMLVFFLVLWVLVIGLKLPHGSYKPKDSLGQVCGTGTEVNKTQLFYFDMDKCQNPLLNPLSTCQTPQVCLESCPNETFFWDTMKDELSFEDLYSRLICLTDKIKAQMQTKEDMEKAIKRKYCARWYSKSTSYFGRCISDISKNICDYLPSDNIREKVQSGIMGLTTPRAPENYRTNSSEECRRLLNETLFKNPFVETFPTLTNLIKNATQNVTNATDKELIEDLKNSWIFILLVCICTLFASLISVVLMRWNPHFWLKGSIGLVLFILGLFTGYSIVRTSLAEDKYFSIFGLHLYENTQWKFISVILFLFGVFLLSELDKQKSSIRFVSVLLKEASKATTRMLNTLYFPVFNFVLFIIGLALTIFICLVLVSTDEALFKDESGNSCDPKTFNISEGTCSLKEINRSWWTNFALFYSGFIFIYLDSLIYDLIYMILASKFVKDYWKSKPTFVSGIHKHIGSVVKGSIRTMFKSLARNLISILPSFLAPFLSWLAKFCLRTQYYNAYIMCADQGWDLKYSGEHSKKLTNQNSTLGFFVEEIGHTFLFYSRMVLVIIAGLVTYFVLPLFSIQHNVLPTIVVCIFAYFLTKGVFVVYGTAMDTLFLCYLLDYEESDGKCTSVGFLQITDEINEKKREKEDEKLIFEEEDKIYQQARTAYKEEKKRKQEEKRQKKVEKKQRKAEEKKKKKEEIKMLMNEKLIGN